MNELDVFDIPSHWFRKIETINTYIAYDPDAIEYLKMETGETFIHLDGTTFFDRKTRKFKLEWLTQVGITHYRLKNRMEYPF